jgi:hypothetical protein
VRESGLAETPPHESVWDLNDLARFMFKRILARRRATLADCTACEADFVHPVEWKPCDEHHWWMLLRCGACGAVREAKVTDDDAAVFDRELTRAERGMRRAADTIGRELQAAHADAFAEALRMDLIGVDDFARGARRARAR